MAKAVTIKVKLVSSADTGFYYVAKKNSRTMTDKLVKKKYDPVARKHVEFQRSPRSSKNRGTLLTSNGASRPRFLFGRLREKNAGPHPEELAKQASRRMDAAARTRGPSFETPRKSAAPQDEVPRRVARRLPPYAVFSIGGALGRISANATWMMPPASPSATPIRHAMV